MNDQIKWLEVQIESARQLLEASEQALKSAQTENAIAQIRLQVFEEALSDEKRKHNRTTAEKSLIKNIRKGKTTIADLAELILRESGPQRTKDILNRLEQRGKNTNLNSLTVILNKGKPHRFDKNDEKKWFAISALPPDEDEDWS